MKRAEARVNLAAVERNCARLREIAGTELCAVVKADAYGHGAAPYFHRVTVLPRSAAGEI